MSSDLLLDSLIRTWVFLPIVIVTFLTGVIRHYTTLYFSENFDIDLAQVRDSQIIIRSRYLRRNCKYIPKSSFLIRREAFNREKTGYLTEPRPEIQQNMLCSPNVVHIASDAIKGNFTIVMPAIIIGGWINWILSGFITTKIPFPLTYHFRSMLQRDIELTHLDACWVSSVSWYFLNVFGMKNLYTLVLGQDNAADENSHMDNQMNKTAQMLSNETKVSMKAEWEGLEIVKHRWVVDRAVNNMVLKSSNN